MLPSTWSRISYGFEWSESESVPPAGREIIARKRGKSSSIEFARISRRWLSASDGCICRVFFLGYSDRSLLLASGSEWSLSDLRQWWSSVQLWFWFIHISIPLIVSDHRYQFVTIWSSICGCVVIKNPVEWSWSVMFWRRRNIIARKKKHKIFQFTMIISTRLVFLALVVAIVCLVDSGLASPRRQQRWRNGNGFYRRDQRGNYQEYSEAFGAAGKCGYEVRIGRWRSENKSCTKNVHCGSERFSSVNESFLCKNDYL